MKECKLINFLDLVITHEKIGNPKQLARSEKGFINFLLILHYRGLNGCSTN